MTWWGVIKSPCGLSSWNWGLSSRPSLRLKSEALKKRVPIRQVAVELHQVGVPFPINQSLCLVRLHEAAQGPSRLEPPGQCQFFLRAGLAIKRMIESRGPMHFPVVNVNCGEEQRGPVGARKGKRHRMNGGRAGFELEHREAVSAIGR